MAPQRNIKLKTVLFSSGLTQRDLSQRAKVPESYLSLAVQGKYIFATDQQQRIASILGVRVADIFSQEVA